MTFEEIIRRIRERDEQVTRCFFFWDGPTQQYIDNIRRTDPQKAARLRRPVCNTCRPGLLSVLHKLSDGEPFDYEEKVTSFYLYIMKDDKLASIKSPDALMSWIVQTAFYFFLREKYKNQAESRSKDDIKELDDELMEDLSSAETRQFVKEVLDAMPNRSYASILDEVSLEAAQFTGQQKAEVIRRKAAEYGISVDNLYVKISLAKKQFRKTAEKLIQEYEK